MDVIPIETEKEPQNDKCLERKTDARTPAEKKEKQKQRPPGWWDVGGGSWDWALWGQERPTHTWRCSEKAKTSPESVSGRTREPECSCTGMPGS